MSSAAAHGHEDMAVSAVQLTVDLFRRFDVGKGPSVCF